MKNRKFNIIGLAVIVGLLLWAVGAILLVFDIHLGLIPLIIVALLLFLLLVFETIFPDKDDL